MGCSGSKESDKTAAGTRDVKENYADMAEDAASMLSGSGTEEERGVMLPLVCSPNQQKRVRGGGRAVMCDATCRVE